MLNNLLITNEMNRFRSNARVNVGAGNISCAINNLLQINILKFTLPHNIGLKS